MKTKRCALCGENKPLDEFFKNRARYDGVSGYCKPCQQGVNAANAQKLRMEVISLLGGPVCVRCGFDDLRALTVDHKDGGGSQHRRDAVSAWGVLRHAKAHPEEYQVLCWNCQAIKRVENGENASKIYRAQVLQSRRESVTRPVRWARDYDCCQGCGTTERPHKAKGLCMNCTMRQRRTGTTDYTYKGWENREEPVPADADPAKV